MNIAYIIIAHRLPEQLVRLVKRLNTAHAFFFIHIDKKAQDEIYTPVYESLRSFRNVIFLKRNTCNWGDFGVTKATLTGLNEAVQNDVKFDYYTLISGQDYPIKSNAYIEEFLEINRGTSYMESFPLSDPRARNFDKRIIYWHIDIFGHHLAFPKSDQSNSRIGNSIWKLMLEKISMRRKVPYGLAPYFGSAYWTLSHECIRYIRDFDRRFPRYVRFFKYVHLPEEMFFQTMLINSPLSKHIVNDDLVRIDWSAREFHPSILRRSDFDQLMESSSLFARKFDVSVDKVILDMIDRVIA